VKSETGGVIAVSSGGVELGSCSLPAGDSLAVADGYAAAGGYIKSGGHFTADEFITVNGYIYNAVNGIADITFTFSGQGEVYLRDWQFVLPKQVTYIDPLKITYAANYPYREGNIVRRAVTDSGSAADLQVEGITNGSALLFDFIMFPVNETIPFSIRSMPVTGGTVEVWAGDFDTVAVFLGECEIRGPAGIWADFNCELYIHPFVAGWPVDDGRCPRWDLMLVFRGDDDGELFAISEFYFGATKPGLADRFEPKVMTGAAQELTPDSAVIVGSEFIDFDEEDILEAGVLYSVDYYMSYDIHKKTAAPATGITPPASGITPPVSGITPPASATTTSAAAFTVTLDDLQDIEEEFDVPYPVYIQYRAYVTTRSGTFLGGVRRFQVAGSGAEPRLELSLSEWNPPAAGSETLLTFESNATWFIETDVPWLEVSHSSGPRNGGTVLYVSENASTASRTGTVTVKIYALDNTALLTRTVTVTQAGTVY